MIGALRGDDVASHPARSENADQAGNDQHRHACDKEGQTEISAGHVVREVLPVRGIESCCQHANDRRGKGITEQMRDQQRNRNCRGSQRGG